MAHQRLLALASPAVIFALLAATPLVGEDKENVKGRFLQLGEGVDLHQYRGAIVVVEPAVLSADKDAPAENEMVRKMSDEKLVATLTGLGLFDRVVSALPVESPPDQPALRVTTKLTLQYGSKAMRFWVGGGAGKSKLHIRVQLVDARSGQELGYFNGYGAGPGFGTGFGSGSPTPGGNVPLMAADDLAENYAKLAKLLKERMQ